MSHEAQGKPPSNKKRRYAEERIDHGSAVAPAFPQMSHETQRKPFLNKKRRDAEEHIHYIHKRIEECKQKRMNKAETVKALLEQDQIKAIFTRKIWEALEKENAEFFNSYYLVLTMMGQIKMFNESLARHCAMKRAQNLRSMQNIAHPVAGGPVPQQPPTQALGKPQFNGIPLVDCFHATRVNGDRCIAGSVPVNPPSYSMSERDLSPASWASIGHFNSTQTDVLRMNTAADDPVPVNNNSDFMSEMDLCPSRASSAHFTSTQSQMLRMNAVADVSQCLPPDSDILLQQLIGGPVPQQPPTQALGKPQFNGIPQVDCFHATRGNGDRCIAGSVPVNPPSYSMSERDLSPASWASIGHFNSTQTDVLRMNTAADDPVPVNNNSDFMSEMDLCPSRASSAHFTSTQSQMLRMNAAADVSQCLPPDSDILLQQLIGCSIPQQPPTQALGELQFNGTPVVDYLHPTRVNGNRCIAGSVPVNPPSYSMSERDLSPASWASIGHFTSTQTEMLRMNTAADDPVPVNNNRDFMSEMDLCPSRASSAHFTSTQSQMLRMNAAADVSQCLPRDSDILLQQLIGCSIPQQPPTQALGELQFNGTPVVDYLRPTRVNGNRCIAGSVPVNPPSYSMSERDLNPASWASIGQFISTQTEMADGPVPVNNNSDFMSKMDLSPASRASSAHFISTQSQMLKMNAAADVSQCLPPDSDILLQQLTDSSLFAECMTPIPPVLD
ncbi:uncharacterized protein LOC131145407 [Malania oleifera]|uniref:uncharacterized protein LOC131145407 n=1 Tax=Malania oleifera TaxID=397392 RepID=UPI0025AE7A3E|nr:uncharacterized protein LOC131145407 [Malania oleifera]